MKKINFSKEYFENEFKQPDRWNMFTSTYEQQKYQRQIELIKLFMPSPQNILEIGCAEGAHTLLLAQNFPDSIIKGIDISETAIERAKKNLYSFEKVELQATDVFNYISKSREKNNIDVIIWSESIYYLGAQLSILLIFDFLKKLIAKLKKGGIICLANIIDQKNREETPLTRKPLIECYYLLLSHLAKPVIHSEFKEYKPESNVTYNYQIWIFKRE